MMLALKFFWFYEYITDVTENQDGDNEQDDHKEHLYFFKKMDGFVKKSEACEACEE